MMKKKTDGQLPKEVKENAMDHGLGMDRGYSLMDAQFKDAQRKGELDNLPGKGKKLDLSKGDALSNILKNANYLPPWVDLQHKIRDEIRRTIALIGQAEEEEIELRIEEINKLVAKYNRDVPNHLLQKTKIFRDSIERQLEKWE